MAGLVDRNVIAWLAEIEASTANFRYYIAAGEQHCIIPADNFYTMETNGVVVRDWVAELAEGTRPENVTCGDTCR